MEEFAHFTASGSMTWTVDSGDRTFMQYYLRGNRLSVQYHVTLTTVGGTLSTQLQITNGQYGGFTWAATTYQGYWAVDNTNAQMALIVAATDRISNWLESTGNWAAATNATTVAGVADAYVT